MKRFLVAITLAGLVAGFADASPTRSLRQRKIEKKRDANKTQLESHRATKTTSSENAAKPTKPAKPSKVSKPAEQASEPSGPSKLTRANKPPSRRFFNKVRTDASRTTSKERRAAAAQESNETGATRKKNLIYRRTWGPRAHNRPR